MIRLARFALVLLTVISVGAGVALAQTKFPPAYDNTATYAPGDLVTDYGNIYRCISAVTKPYQDPTIYYSEWELFHVRSNTSIMVGVDQTFPTLQAAWTYAQNCTIAQGAYLHFDIITTKGDYTMALPTQFSLDQPCGANISIIGDNAFNIQIGGTSGATTNAFALDSNHTFGSLTNLGINGSGTTVDATSGYAVYTSTGASISNVSGLIITNFNYGVYADSNSTQNIAANVLMTGCQYAIGSAHGALVNVATGWTNKSGGQACLVAYFGGTIIAQGCVIANWSQGLQLDSDAKIFAYECNISKCQVGVTALVKSFAEVGSGKFSDNTLDLNVTASSIIDAGFASFKTQSADSYSSYIFT